MTLPAAPCMFEIEIGNELQSGRSDGAEPEGAEDADGGKAFGPKRNVANCVAAAEIVGGTGAWVGDVQVG